jgi:hypothetical protein
MGIKLKTFNPVVFDDPVYCNDNQTRVNESLH